MDKVRPKETGIAEELARLRLDLSRLETQVKGHNEWVSVHEYMLREQHDPLLSHHSEAIEALQITLNAVSGASRRPSVCDGISVHIGPRPILVVAFGGINEAFGWERRLASLGLCIIHMKDTRNRWYVDGCDGVNDVDQMVDIVRLLMSAIPHERRLTLGQSMGGYPALRFAEALGADLTLAFAPQTHCAVATALPGASLVSAPPDAPDLRPALAQTTIPTHIFLSRSELANPPETFFWDDWAHLQGLHDNPAIKIHTVLSDLHSVTRSISPRGKMNKVIESMISISMGHPASLDLDAL